LLVDPLTGEGIGNAMTSGKLAAEHAQRALANGADLGAELESYDASIWRALGPTLETSYRLQRLVAHPITGKLVEALMSQAARHPRVRETIVRLVQQDLEAVLAPLKALKRRVSSPV
jgi:flavin-dependent dehydrogenase